MFGVNGTLCAGEFDLIIGDCLQLAVEHDIVVPVRHLDRVDRWRLDFPYPPYAWPDVDAWLSVLRDRTARASEVDA